MKTNNQKHDNKGFSLVELIVVIAIMAVLVAVLAPQFTKYIDRSRQSNDATTVAGIVTAAEVAAADSVDYENVKAGTYTIIVAKNGTTVATTDENAKKDMEQAIIDSCGELTELKCTANGWNDAGEIKIEVTIANSGAVTVEYKTDEFAKYIGKTPASSENSDNK